MKGDQLPKPDGVRDLHLALLACWLVEAPRGRDIVTDRPTDDDLNLGSSLGNT